MLEPLFPRCWKWYNGQSSIVGLGREKKEREVLVVGVTNPRLLLLSRVHGMSETRTTAQRWLLRNPCCGLSGAHLCGARPFTTVTSEVMGERVKWR